MRIVFLGTPEFAVPVLDALRVGGFTIAAVISQPDREKDKKGNILSTPVKAYAQEHGLPCLQFDRLSQHIEDLQALAPDVMITAAYGQLLSQAVLDVPKWGVLNVHASLLPKYRGSSPIQSALLAGEQVTGITIMKTDIGMDTGDILQMQELPIQDGDTTGSLSEKLAALGARLLVRTLPEYAAGRIVPVPQDSEKATHCKKISKADGNIDWSSTAWEIDCKIRAFSPWPIAYTYLDGVPLKIYEAKATQESLSGEAGTVHVQNGTAAVTCGSGSLRLSVVQIPGKKAMPIAEFLRGRKIPDKSVLKNA